MKVFKKITLLALALSLNSCALLFNGSRQNVDIKSMTPEAQIYVDGELAGTNAVSQKLMRKDNHTVMIKKDGYKTETVMIDSNVQAGWIVFDALFNWFAFLTDAPTGAWKGFDKTNITVELQPEANADASMNK